ncbi:MAG: hypothetical protein ACREUE_05850, partial [Panacagrimonas sp.]
MSKIRRSPISPICKIRRNPIGSSNRIRTIHAVSSKAAIGRKTWVATGNRVSKMTGNPLSKAEVAATNAERYS